MAEARNNLRNVWGRKKAPELMTMVEITEIPPPHTLSFAPPPSPVQHRGQKPGEPGVRRGREGAIPFISLNVKGECVPASAFAEAQMLVVLLEVVEPV